MRKSRSIHQRIWEEHNGKTIPKGYHIHHIDGDRKNNSTKNLICVSPQEHYDLHYKEYLETGSLKHFAACNFLKKEIDNPKPLVSPKKGTKCSEESKKKMSKSMKGRPAWNKGIKMSDEWRMNLSKSHKGYKWTEEQRKKYKESKTGKPNKNNKPFMFYGKIFNTLEECQKEIGKGKTYIWNRIKKGKHKDCYYV